MEYGTGRPPHKSLETVNTAIDKTGAEAFYRDHEGHSCVSGISLYYWEARLRWAKARKASKIRRRRQGQGGMKGDDLGDGHSFHLESI